jgi:hypothetical protein
MSVNSPVPNAVRGLDSELTVRELGQTEAEALAAPLFWRSFANPLPDHPRHFGLFAKDAPGLLAYVHLLPFRGAYLGGGLCVDGWAFRRLPAKTQESVRRAHGLGQMALAGAIAQAGDTAGVFGYLGDPRSKSIVTRLGFVPTPFERIFALWLSCQEPEARAALTESVAALGPF